MRASRRIPLLTASGLMITPLSVARAMPVAAAIHNSILISGGLLNHFYDQIDNLDDGRSADTVDAYDAKLVRNTINPLSTARNAHAAAANEDYILIGGGKTQLNEGIQNDQNGVNAYNSALVQSSPTALSVARSNLSACSNGKQIIYAGGFQRIPGGSVSTVDGYSTALVRTIPTGLSAARTNPGATSNGPYMIIAGGSALKIVDAYNAAFTRSIPAALTTARSQPAAARIGNYALYAGGSSSPYTDIVEAYDATLTHIVLTIGLSTARRPYQAISTSGYALIGGMDYDGSVDAYDATLSRHVAPMMTIARDGYAGAAGDRYMVFAGGATGKKDFLNDRTYDHYSADVDAYNNNLEHFASA